MRITSLGTCAVLSRATACAALCIGAVLYAQTWVHPGIVVSPQQLAATRTAYQNSDSTVVNQVAKAMSSSYGSISYTVQGYYPGGINQCGANSIRTTAAPTQIMTPTLPTCRRCCGT